MKRPGPIDLITWMFRRSERDVIDLYDYLSGLMRLVTGDSMLNFGYWDGEACEPISAQQGLCTRFGRLAVLRPGQRIIDVGCGYGVPAARWCLEYGPIEMVPVDLNWAHLSDMRTAPNSTLGPVRPHMVNATATALPFGPASADRVLAFESAHHFRPLDRFLTESFRILRSGGKLAVAIPVTVHGTPALMVRLGLLSATWSSEKYSDQHIVSSIKRAGFEVESIERIGPRVYGPIADYYEQNRHSIRERILDSYPGYVESLLCRSLRQMRDVSQKGLIDYMLVACRKA